MSADANSALDMRVPATVITGFLGAGKTTLLNHILRSADGLRIAVIVNDMSEVNIDADLVRGADLSRMQESLVELSNGCICCTLRADLLSEVRRLCAAGRFDYLVIEGTGIAEPLPIAATFSFRDEQGVSLSDVARLDTMVTVVDAANILSDYVSSDFLRDRGEARAEDDERKLVDLLVEQVEFADVIVINKASEVSPAKLGEVLRVVRALNADAEVSIADFGCVDMRVVVATGRFSEKRAATHPLWHKELYGFGEHLPETEEYGIGSFVYRARRPFHPERFHALLERAWPGLLRAKGHFWLATRPDWIGQLSIAGSQRKVDGRGFWWSAVPKAHWPRHDQFRNLLARHWSDIWGDRRQELVFIGSGLEEAALREALDDCLWGADEHFDPQPAHALRDPFPQWSGSAHHHH